MNETARRVIDSPDDFLFTTKFIREAFSSENDELLADIYLTELEDCIMSKTRHDSFSGESYDITSLNYPRSKIILYRFAEAYHQRKLSEEKAEYCEWKPSTTPFAKGFYESSCTLISTGKDLRYCTYCGKPIKIKE